MTCHSTRLPLTCSSLTKRHGPETTISEIGLLGFYDAHPRNLAELAVLVASTVHTADPSSSAEICLAGDVGSYFLNHLAPPLRDQFATLDAMGIAGAGGHARPCGERRESGMGADPA